MDPQFPIDILDFRGGSFREARVEAIREAPLTIHVCGREVIRLLCSGMHPHYLAVGYLYSCGVIAGAGDIEGIDVEETERCIDVRVTLRGEMVGTLGVDVTSGLGRMVRTNGPRPWALASPEEPWVRSENIVALAGELHARSELYRRTRGCHNSSLCTPEEMLLFRSDIGRHNAIDTLVGQCLLEGLPVADKMIVTTGRIASEIVHKTAMAGVPVLASTAVATALAVERAREYGLTLIGNVTRDGFWVYNDSGRLAAG